MKISYDTQVDALYIRFLDGPFQVTTQRLSEDVAVNYGPDGRIVGIEVLDASNYAFAEEARGKIELDNLVVVPSASFSSLLRETPPDYLDDENDDAQS